jgi:hypothetical protein
MFQRVHRITSLDGVTSRKALIFINNTVRTSNYGTRSLALLLSAPFICGEDEVGGTGNEVDTQITILYMKMLFQRRLKQGPAEVGVSVPAFDTLSMVQVT